MEKRQKTRSWKNLLGQYETHFKIGLATGVLSLLFMVPLAKLSLADPFWFFCIIPPMVFAGVAGILLARNLRKPSRIDALAAALAFAVVYVLALMLSTPVESIFWFGNNLFGTPLVIYFFSALGAGIGRYVSPVVK
ncbi:MAG: hypothetical protein NTY90_04425 [Candidatus Micrarchaeota archaeon]|nr:hypothetical protein [Candidatus Micrarchaeota archaeon]